MPDLLTGAEDAQWVQIEGVVHSVTESATNVNLQVAMASGIIAATTVRQPGVDYQYLVDKSVHIRGNAAPIFNANRQLTGARMFFPGLETVTATAPDSGGAFTRPVRPVNGLLRFDPSNLWPHRVHISRCRHPVLAGPHHLRQGRDRWALCADHANHAAGRWLLCRPGRIHHPLGIQARLVGRHVPAAPHGPVLAASATPITPEQALKGDHDSDLVQMDGKLIGRDLASTDAALILSSGKSVFHVFLPPPTPVQRSQKSRSEAECASPAFAPWRWTTRQRRKASALPRFRPTGSCCVRSRDIAVLETPSWWTADRVRFALLFTLAITVAGFVWVFVLRRRVEHQTRELRESRELYRHMAHHDSLTGLATRTLLHDRLQNALSRAQRFHKSIALLMLDLDKFKEVNDYFGHSAGDQVLRVTANRIRANIRKTDSVARMGGDEFIVLLNDLANEDQAEQIAAKIVAALSEPIDVGKFQVPISVSVGVCTVVDENVNAEVLLRRVDAAMYRAKASGRGCFQVFTDDMAAAMRSSHFPEIYPIEFSILPETDADISRKVN